LRIRLASIPAVVVAVALGLWASVAPTLRAARVEPHDLSLAERIFASASEQEAAMKQLPFEERSPDLYPRVVDLYRQVTETAADAALVDRARMRLADLTCEMGLRTGDASQFAAAIDVYRGLVISRPDSPYLGEALIAIAEVYERNLQDVDGAMAAYREIARRFPRSVSGREAEANLVRLDPSSLGGDTGTDIIGEVVAAGAEVSSAAEDAPEARVVNVRSFAGPDYARIVVDLNRPVAYRERREGTRVTYMLEGAGLSATLVGRRLATERGSLLRQMRIEQMGDGVAVTLDAATLESAAAFMMDDPSRLVIDLRGKGAGPSPRPLSLRPRRDEAPGIDIAGMAPGAAPRPDIPAPPAPVGPDTVEAPPVARGPVRCIVIDPGHGGHDTGTIGPGGLPEKDLTLDIARRVRASLRAELPGVEIILTRDSDRYISLEERTAIANARNADLFISIHANASQSSAASGVETYVLDPNAKPEEGGVKAKPASQVYASVSAAQVSESRAFAGFVQSSLVRGIKAKSPRSARDRGIKHASFAVLRGSRMPSALAEVSFVSNPDDENRLRQPAFRQRIAASLVGGIRDYARKTGAR
jgi:N-acetylmuramoyl-L-alanine amidase